MRRLIGAAAVFAMLAVACGQYSNVHEQAVASGEIASSEFGTGEAADGTGLDGTTTGTTGTGTGTTGTGAGTTTTTTGSDPTSPTTSGQDPNAPTGPGTTTGVTEKSIKIGLHAPLTGAAPISPASFRDGKDLYWDHGNGGKPVVIHGRQVEVVFRDDQYNPTHARDVCKEMAEDEQVFLLVGGGGTDQINACANYAAQVGVPYLSAGVTEVGMNLQNTFAVSMTYPDQVPLLVNYIKSTFTKNPDEVAMVATDTPYFDDAVQAFEQSFQGATVFRHSKNESAGTMAQRLCTGTVRNFEVVFPLVAPVYYLEMAKQAKCNPQYAGVGITMGLDTVANAGCAADGSTNGARFLSPGSAYAQTDQYDKNFRQNGGEDDIMWLLWGLSATLAHLFDNAGPNLSREGFIAATENASVNTGIYPTLNYSPSNHFAASGAYMLRNVCQGNSGFYTTEKKYS